MRAEPARAESLLEDLSDLFRHALAEQSDAVTLAQEIELAERYLAIEQVRFGNRLKVEWDLDDGVDHALLPPLLLQPLVENAVKHGVEPDPQGGRLRIRTYQRGSMACIDIDNTVPSGPTAPSAGHGIALANVRDRLRLLHDVHGRFDASPQGKCYRVHIELPMP